MPIARKLLKAVPWRNLEIVERPATVQDDELTERDSLNIVRQPLGELSVPDAFCLSVGEGLDHWVDVNASR
jgi:hypothetical protein